MTLYTIITTGIVYLWMFAIVGLLWRGQQLAVKHTAELQHTLIDLAMHASETAKTSSEATRRLTLFLEKQGG